MLTDILMSDMSSYFLSNSLSPFKEGEKKLPKTKISKPHEES